MIQLAITSSDLAARVAPTDRAKNLGKTLHRTHNGTFLGLRDAAAEAISSAGINNEIRVSISDDLVYPFVFANLKGLRTLAEIRAYGKQHFSTLTDKNPEDWSFAFDYLNIERTSAVAYPLWLAEWLVANHKNKDSGLNLISACSFSTRIYNLACSRLPPTGYLACLSGENVTLFQFKESELLQIRALKARDQLRASNAILSWHARVQGDVARTNYLKIFHAGYVSYSFKEGVVNGVDWKAVPRITTTLEYKKDKDQLNDADALLLASNMISKC